MTLISSKTERKVDDINFKVEGMKSDLDDIKESIRLLLEGKAKGQKLNDDINADDFESAEEM